MTKGTAANQSPTQRFKADKMLHAPKQVSCSRPRRQAVKKSVAISPQFGYLEMVNP